MTTWKKIRRTQEDVDRENRIFDSYQDFCHKVSHYRDTEGFPKWSVEQCQIAGYWFEMAWRGNKSCKSFPKMAGIAWRAMNMTMEHLSEKLAAERRIYVNGGSPVWRLVMSNPGIEKKLSQEEIDELKVITLM